MPNNVITLPTGQVAAAFQGVQGNDNLTQGIRQKMPRLSVRGKSWHVQLADQEIDLIDQATGLAVPFFECVIVGSSPFVSRAFYNTTYDPTNDSPPACKSSDGVYPDRDSEAPQHASCAGCPKDVFGSAVSNLSQKPVKACSEFKFLALVAAGDPGCRTTEVPLRLQVPQQSLKELASYGRQLQVAGIGGFFQVVTQISFDPAEAYPKLKFKAVRYVDEATAPIIVDWIKDPRLKDVTAEATAESLRADRVQAPAAPAQEAVQMMQPQPQVAQMVQPNVATTQAPPSPVQQPVQQPQAVSPAQVVQAAQPTPAQVVQAAQAVQPQPAQAPAEAPASNGATEPPADQMQQFKALVASLTQG